MRKNENGRPALRHLSSLYLTESTPKLNQPGKKYRLFETAGKQLQFQEITQASESTIHDFLASAVDALSPLRPAHIHSPYSLQEDIAILTELAPLHSINEAAFDRLAASKRLHRARWSLQQRYEEFVLRLREKDIDSICTWIERFGVVGFASFQGEHFLVSFFDSPDELKSEAETQDQSLLEKETGIAEKDLKYRGIKHGLFDDLESLNKVLIIYSSMVRKPIKQLLELLHQACGDFCDLDHYLETNDRRVLWTDNEDKILHFEVSDRSELELYRSAESIAKRRRYLGIL